MLAATHFRAGGAADLVRESQRKRFAPVEWVKEAIDLEEELRAASKDLEAAERDRNRLSKEIGALLKARDLVKAEALKAEAKTMSGEVHAKQEAQKKLSTLRDDKLRQIANIVDPAVPEAHDAAGNRVERSWGEAVAAVPCPQPHATLLHQIDGWDFDKARWGVHDEAVKGYGLLLQQAIVNYSLAFLSARGYCPIQPPSFVPQNRVDEMGDEKDEFIEMKHHCFDKVGNGRFLIPSATLACHDMHASEVFTEQDLPIRYAVLCTCFRRRAPVRMRSMSFLYPIQADTVEQFVMCAPDRSSAELANMTRHCEEFYQSLGIPYDVTTVASGELARAESIRCTLEGSFVNGTSCWLASCSNYTDYQARGADIRFCRRDDQKPKSENVHTLSATLVLGRRTLCALLETWQREAGIAVPPVLQPFLGSVSEILFTKALKNARSGAPAPIPAWRPVAHIHARYPRLFRNVVVTALALGNHEGCRLTCLPLELLCYVFELLAEGHAPADVWANVKSLPASSQRASAFWKSVNSTGSSCEGNSDL